MINFNKNDLIDAVLLRFFDTFRCTLDVSDFVPEKFLDKIDVYIFKCMKKAFRMIDKTDRVYQKARKKLEEMLHAAARSNPGVIDRGQPTVPLTGDNDQSEQATSLSRLDDEPQDPREEPDLNNPLAAPDPTETPEHDGADNSSAPSTQIHNHQALA